MLRSRVGARVLTGRAVAAAHVPAGATEPEVDPLATVGEALGAPGTAGERVGVHEIQVGAGSGHGETSEVDGGSTVTRATVGG